MTVETITKTSTVGDIACELEGSKLAVSFGSERPVEKVSLITHLKMSGPNVYLLKEDKHGNVTLRHRVGEYKYCSHDVEIPEEQREEYAIAPELVRAFIETAKKHGKAMEDSLRLA